MSKENFFEINLGNKINLLQDEHKQVLRVLYNDACAIGAINNNQFDSNISQSLSYSRIKETLEKVITKEILVVCLQDLENAGFIYNAMRNNYQETSFAIGFLGFEFFKNN